VLFSIGVRFVPDLVDRAIRKLGYGGQLTDGTASPAAQNTTLFTASDRASPVHGTFDAEARSGSLHVRMLYAFAVLTRQCRRMAHSRPYPVETTKPAIAEEEPV
jgi:hypothetical protein